VAKTIKVLSEDVISSVSKIQQKAKHCVRYGGREEGLLQDGNN